VGHLGQRREGALVIAFLKRAILVPQSFFARPLFFFPPDSSARICCFCPTGTEKLATIFIDPPPLPTLPPPCKFRPRRFLAPPLNYQPTPAESGGYPNLTLQHHHRCLSKRSYLSHPPTPFTLVFHIHITLELDCLLFGATFFITFLH